jgi:HK97 family phage major capsid protein
MTIEEVLAQLRELAQRRQQGEDVSAQTAAASQELAALGDVPPAQAQAQMRDVLKNTRGGSRFAGPNADPDAVAHLAAGGSFGPNGEALPGGMFPAGSRIAEPPNYGQRGAIGGERPSLAGTMTKALAESTPSAGGVLVPVEVSREIVDLVRKRVAILRLSPTFVPVEKELDLPYLSTGAVAYYVEENARIPVSEQTFALIPKLRPIELAALVPVSNRLLRDARTSPELENALRSDMAQALAGRQELAFLQGLGGGTEPLGVRNQTGMTPAPALGANGAMPTLADFQRMIGAVRAANAPFARPGWIFHPNVLTYLETLRDSTGRPLLDTDLLKVDASGGGGTFLNYRFETTGLIPTTLTRGTSTAATYVIFSSDWNDAWVGENMELTIDASGEATYSTDGGTTHISAWQQRQTVFRAQAAHDFALRRPEFFTVMEGVLTA